MAQANVLFLLLASLGLAACDPAKKPASVASAPKAAVTINEAAELQPQAPVDADQATAIAQPASASERLLNLSYASSAEDENAAKNQPQLEGSKDMLPDMFAQKKADNISLSGGLLTDPEKEEYIDSVNGAEVSIKVRTH